MASCVYALVCLQINFLLLISRQGKTRLTKWYQTYSAKVRREETNENEKEGRRELEKNNRKYTAKKYCCFRMPLLTDRFVV